MTRTSRTCWWSVVLHFLSAISSCYTLLILFSLHGCLARDNITVHFSVADGQTIASAGNRFELGFFGPSGSSNVKRYAGIWYTSNPQTVVWVANRDEPLPDKTGVLHFADGNLKLSDEKEHVYWSTQLPLKGLNLHLVVAKLNDTGNLIMYVSDQLGTITNLWQSFDNPTDTFLLGMKMDESFVLHSWKSEEDPAPGNFMFKKDLQAGRFVVMNKSITHWRSLRESGQIFGLLNNLNFSGDDIQVHMNERLVMNFTGDLQYWKFDSEMKNGSLIWWEPRDRCSKYNYCGNFGTCNVNNKLPCKCLPGFKPKLSEKWNTGGFGDGCSRNSASYGDYFLSLKRMELEYPESPFNVSDEKACKDECLGNSQCQAYSVNVSDNNRTLSCLIWIDELKNIQDDQVDGYKLYVRLPLSDLESTYRSCVTCGTNLVPYPLSTGSSCGDPMYHSFYCDDDTDQLSFMTTSGNYTVTNVNTEAHIFVIKIQSEEAVNCKAIQLSGNKILQLIPSSPFDVSSSCSSDVGNFTNASPLNGTIEVEISWRPPLEPICNSSADCKDWPFSTCNETRNRQKRCLCRPTFSWDGSALNCTPVAKQSEESFNRSKGFPLILVVSLPIALAFLCSIVSIYLWRKKMVKKRAKQRKARLHRYDTERGVKELMESSHFEGKDGTGIDVPFFDFESIRAATDNFSDEHKLGKGGFGPVYKGKFPGARMIQGKQTEGSTRRVVGTYGYMAPEYALEGVFSVKSDVFSFSVVMLEIISGKKNTRFYHVENTPSLIAYAWRLWQEGEALDLTDETLRSSCNASEVLRCLHVGLLCVQEDPDERPNMSSVLVLLGSETASLPVPKQPAFPTRRTLSSTASTSSKAETNTEITASAAEGQ
ncbi:hypothetical protein V6N12_012300 [Hibiscus sabdariffa]|uniref:Receptor-like serine/threonine-protein kinase n=1 Tax=Hibiscus sabdariffa TaxID=183260 RepID=A0ABR2CJU1_9ROSI